MSEYWFDSSNKDEITMSYSKSDENQYRVSSKTNQELFVRYHKFQSSSRIMPNNDIVRIAIAWPMTIFISMPILALLLFVLGMFGIPDDSSLAAVIGIIVILPTFFYILYEYLKGPKSELSIAFLDKFENQIVSIQTESINNFEIIKGTDELLGVFKSRVLTFNGKIHSDHGIFDLYPCDEKGIKTLLPDKFGIYDESEKIMYSITRTKIQANTSIKITKFQDGPQIPPILVIILAMVSIKQFFEKY